MLLYTLELKLSNYMECINYTDVVYELMPPSVPEILSTNYVDINDDDDVISPQCYSLT